MVRATAAEVLKLFGGTYPPGTSAANITDLLTDADYIIDGYVRKHYKSSLSTTDMAVIHMANQIVARLGMRILWYQAGGVLSGTPEPEMLTSEMKDIIESMVADTTTDDSTMTLDAIDESDT